MAGSDQLADTFAAIAREMEAASGPEETRQVVTRRAVDMVPGCTFAGISLIRRGGSIITVAATSEDADRIHQIQNELNEGPGLSAIIDHVVYQIDDLPSEQRWPRFAGRVGAEMSVASMLSFRLFTSEDTTGALNLYAAKPDTFGADSRAVGTALAAHAAIAMLAANDHEDVANLHTALRTSRQIGIAIGLIMRDEQLTQDQAFNFLINVSQRLNRKLRDVADVIVESGGLPGSLDSRQG